MTIQLGDLVRYSPKRLRLTHDRRTLRAKWTMEMEEDLLNFQPPLTGGLRRGDVGLVVRLIQEGIYEILLNNGQGTMFRTVHPQDWEVISSV